VVCPDDLVHLAQTALLVLLAQKVVAENKECLEMMDQSVDQEQRELKVNADSRDQPVCRFEANQA
jgi:hypothetical protein